MFKKSHPLQSKSEIILRNIVVLAMVVFFYSIFDNTNRYSICRKLS